MSAAISTDSDMLDWMWGYVCNAADLIQEYAESGNCGSPGRAAEWRKGLEDHLRPKYHEHVSSDVKC